MPIISPVAYASRCRLSPFFARILGNRQQKMQVDVSFGEYLIMLYDMMWTLLFVGILVFAVLITVALIHKQPKRKIVMLCVVLLAFVLLLVGVSLLFLNHVTKWHDSDDEIVLYPTTELVTDSFVIDSTASVWNATVYISGHLSDTMFVSFTDGSYPSWDDIKLIGDIDEEISNDWYSHRLHVQHRSNSVTEGDSVVMTCEFAR